ncbi:hypothetical protein V6N13_071168 [Hibiscus sabdariffa]
MILSNHLIPIKSRALSPTFQNSTSFPLQPVQNYRIVWTGLSSILARGVPFSAICWAALEPIRRKLLVSVGDEAGAGSILVPHFAAGFVAESIAAAITCPLDVVNTRR